MKSFVFQDRLNLDELRLVERPIPKPAARDVLLKMRAASLNFRDLLIARGRYGQYPLPRIPLSDGAGEVVAVGTQVRRFQVGDLVCPIYVPDWLEGSASETSAKRRLGGPVDGVLTEYMCVHEDEAVRAPRHYNAREAATLPVAGATAWQALFTDGVLRPGDTVCVQGSGGVSLFCVQLARMTGARVVSVSRGCGPRKERLEGLGALVVDAGAADWVELVKGASDGKGVDVFVNVVGGAGLTHSIAATRVGGTVLLVGFVGGSEAPLDLLTTIRRSVLLRAVSGGSRHSFEALVRALEANETRPVIDRVFPFAEARRAYEHMESSRPFGKVVLEFNDK